MIRLDAWLMQPASHYITILMGLVVVLFVLLIGPTKK